MFANHLATMDIIQLILFANNVFLLVQIAILIQAVPLA